MIYISNEDGIFALRTVINRGKSVESWKEKCKEMKVHFHSISDNDQDPELPSYLIHHFETFEISLQEDNGRTDSYDDFNSDADRVRDVLDNFHLNSVVRLRRE